MQAKIFSKRLLLIVVFPVFAFSLLVLFYFFPKYFDLSADTPVQDSQLPSEDVVIPLVQEQPSFGIPLRLKIPKINVDAAVEYVGLTPKGAMDVPKDPANVAWLKLGPRPGENGSAVLAGHYGIWKNGDRSVFDNLKKLATGDKINIVDEKGLVTSFVVRESRRYEANADAKDVFSSSDGKSHLNLITCENWDKASESYSKRLVIFSDKE